MYDVPSHIPRSNPKERFKLTYSRKPCCCTGALAAAVQEGSGMRCSQEQCCMLCLCTAAVPGTQAPAVRLVSFRALPSCSTLPFRHSQGWGLPLSTETQAKGIDSCSFFPFLLATGMNFSLEPAGRSETRRLRAAQALLCPSDAGLLSCCSCGTQCCVHPHCPQGVSAWAGDASASGGGERKPRARPRARPQPCDGEQAFGANI